VRKSAFNIIVTNTEKIRIQKETIRKTDLGILGLAREDEARAGVANLRLQAIASLPHLAIFSDEAHHTYGQTLDTELKKVRKTVDYLAANTNVICVVNTTGTPLPAAASQGQSLSGMGFRRVSGTESSKIWPGTFKRTISLEMRGRMSHMSLKTFPTTTVPFSCLTAPLRGLRSTSRRQMT